MKFIPKDERPLTFGKYNGKTPEEIGEIDPSYVVWMYENVRPTPCSKELAEACEQDVREMEAERDVDDWGFSHWDRWDLF